MPVIPVNRLVDKKRMIGKNGGLRRRRGTREKLNDKSLCIFTDFKKSDKKSFCTKVFSFFYEYPHTIKYFYRYNTF
jgi:hypothetical protein